MSKLTVFKFTDPYKALILAEDQDKAIDLYRDTVADYDPAENDLPMEMDEDSAWRMLWNVIGRCHKTAPEAVMQMAQTYSDLKGGEPCILCVDGALA